MKRLIPLALALSLLAQPCLATNLEGLYQVEGAGILTCKILLKHHDDPFELGIIFWMQGFLSSANRDTKGVSDLTDGRHMEWATKRITHWCKGHPEERIATGIGELVDARRQFMQDSQTEGEESF